MRGTVLSAVGNPAVKKVTNALRSAFTPGNDPTALDTLTPHPDGQQRITHEQYRRLAWAFLSANTFFSNSAIMYVSMEDEERRCWTRARSRLLSTPRRTHHTDQPALIAGVKRFSSDSISPYTYLSLSSYIIFTCCINTETERKHASMCYYRNFLSSEFCPNPEPGLSVHP